MRCSIAILLVGLFTGACDGAGMSKDTLDTTPEDGGSCDDVEYVAMALDELREGITGEQVIAEFSGERESALVWTAEVSDGSIAFAQNGTMTNLAMTLSYDGGAVRWYPASNVSGARSCAARLAVELSSHFVTEDGAVDFVRSAFVQVNTVSPDERDALGLYEATLELEMAMPELGGTLEITEITPEPAVPLRPRVRVGFWQDGSWEGSIRAQLQEVVGEVGATGHDVLIADW